MTHNKANKSKILALILGLTMCIALMLGIAFASPTRTVYAEGGTGTTGGLTIGGESDMSGTGYSYEGATQTLTLNGYNGKEIDFSGKTIKVEGNNTITVDENSNHRKHPSYADLYQYYGIFVKSSNALTISGKGSLTLNIDTTKIGDESEFDTLGIATGGDLFIKEEVKITINANVKNYRGTAISTYNLSIIDSAYIDITMNGNVISAKNITFAGDGEKKIKMKTNDWHFYCLDANKGFVDISGKGKVAIDVENGKNTWVITAWDNYIKIHDNANVEVNGGYYGFYSRYDSAPTNHTGIEITDSTVKITSSVDNSSTSAFITSGNQKITIKNSAVTAESPKNVFSCSEETVLELLGSSTVYLKGSYPAIWYSENHIFDLTTGGSITLESTLYTVPIYAKLGTNTSVEAGTKGDEVTAGIFKYRPFEKHGLRLWRFVYGDTTVASAVADDVTISGITDAALTEQDVKLTITGDDFKAIAKDTDVTAWFKNMPKGLSAKAKADVVAGATEMTITISGTPTEAKAASLWIEIPVGTLKTTNYGMTVVFENAKYDIVSGTPVDCPEGIKGLVFNQFEQNGIPANEAYTVQNGREINAGKYTATLTLKTGYKWSDGTTAPKTVEWEIARRPIEVELTIEKDKYEYTGYAITPSYTVRLKTSLSELETSEYSVSYANNKEIGMATMTVSDKDGGNYQITAPVSKTFEIVKGTKTPPSGLKGIAPSADGATDGKITGTTAAMEYSTDTAFTSPTPCTDTETTGLAEGTYYVRYKATTTTEASNYVAIHVRLNTVTVVDANTTVTKHKSGTSVTVTVTIPTGKSFKKWVYEGVTIPMEDVTKQEITFTMPETDVVLTALFEDIIYNITVTNGTSNVPTAKYQAEVTVKANEPDTDMYFDKWEITGLDTTGMDLTKTEIKFQMPAGNVTFKATYRNAENYVVTVTGGTGGGTYKEGDEVTVTAEDKEGKVFKGWKDESGEIVSTDKSYTFKVEGEKTLTAVYDDKSSGGGEITPPAKKDGLSGGQIAGIVIGSVLLAGIGGFAIYWFAISKKTFADLGVALKKVFTAIGNFFKTLGAKIKALFTKKK